MEVLVQQQLVLVVLVVDVVIEVVYLVVLLLVVRFDLQVVVRLELQGLLLVFLHPGVGFPRLSLELPPTVDDISPAAQ